MSENGIIAYDLGRGMFCEECGRAKSFRIWPGARTGCKTCDEVVTRHRCTKRPALDGLEIGASWKCPDCGTAWTVIEKEELCGECGQVTGMRKGWWKAVPGDRIDSAPRHDPQPFTPFRNLLPRAAVSSPPGPFGSCYAMPGGAMVHVRPGCRCKY